MSFPKRFAVLLLLAVLVAIPAAAQSGPAEPNAGTHIQFSSSYGSAAVTGISVPVSDRWAINLVNAFNSNQEPEGAAASGLSFHTVELEYARNLSDVFRSKSSQFNPDRFDFAVSAGAGSVRNAQGSGNASFAFSVAGRVTLKLNDSTSLDLVNVRYWRSRIATVFGQQNAGSQAGIGFRFRF